MQTNGYLTFINQESTCIEEVLKRRNSYHFDCIACHWILSPGGTSWEYLTNRPMLIYKNSASNNRPQYEALGNKYRVCGVYSQQPRSEVYCLENWSIRLHKYIIMLFAYSVNLRWRMFNLKVALTVCLIPVSQLFNWIQKKYLLNRRKIFAPNVGLEPTTLRLRVSCSTDWASRARWWVCKFSIGLPSSSDRCDAWEKWIDNFDQTKAHSSFREALFKPCRDRRILVFIGG